MTQVLPDAASEDDDPAIAGLAGALAAEDVQVYYQIVINGRRDLPWVPDPRLGFEMTLLRLLAFRPGEATGATVGAPRSTGSGQASGATNPGASPARAKAAAAGTPQATAQDPDWSQRVDQLGLEGFAKQLARHCEWRGRDGDRVQLALDPAAKHLLKDERRVAIEQALAQLLGAAIKLSIEPATGATRTPARLDDQRELERQRAAEQAIDADPAVRALKEKFGATVRAGSVQPTGSNGNGATK